TLAQELLHKTTAGEIRWLPTFDEGTLRLLLTTGMVHIIQGVREGDDVPPHHYGMAAWDASGQHLGLFLPTDVSATQVLANLWQAALQSCHRGPSDPIDKMLEELRHPVG